MRLFLLLIVINNFYKNTTPLSVFVKISWRDNGENDFDYYKFLENKKSERFELELTGNSSEFKIKMKGLTEAYDIYHFSNDMEQINNIELKISIKGLNLKIFSLNNVENDSIVYIIPRLNKTKFKKITKEQQENYKKMIDLFKQPVRVFQFIWKNPIESNKILDLRIQCNDKFKNKFITFLNKQKVGEQIFEYQTDYLRTIVCPDDEYNLVINNENHNLKCGEAIHSVDKLNVYEINLNNKESPCKLMETKGQVIQEYLVILQTYFMIVEMQMKEIFGEENGIEIIEDWKKNNYSKNETQNIVNQHLQPSPSLNVQRNHGKNVAETSSQQEKKSANKPPIHPNSKSKDMLDVPMKKQKYSATYDYLCSNIPHNFGETNPFHQMDAMHNLQQLKYYDLKHTIDDLQINGPQKIQLEEACKNATNEYLGLREENNRRLYNLCPGLYKNHQEKMKRVNSPCYRGSPEEAFDISQQYLLSQLKINQPEIQHTEAQTLHTLQQQRTLPKDIQTQMFLPQNEGAPQPNQQTFQKCFGNQQHLPLHQYMPTNVVAQPQTDLVLNNQFDHNQLLQNSNIEPLNLFNNMPPYYSGYHQSEDDGIVEKRTLDEYQNLPENVARQKGKNIVQDHQLRGNVSGPLNGHGVQVPGTTTNFPPPIFNSDYVDDDQANELMPMIFSQNKQLNMNPALNPQMLHPFTQNFHSQMPEKGQHSMEYASHSLQSNPPSHSQGNIQNLLSFSSDPINANLGNIFNTYPPIHLNFY